MSRLAALLTPLARAAGTAMVIGAASWAFDRALRSVAEAQRVSAETLASVTHQTFALPDAPQLPPEHQGNGALFETFMESAHSRLPGTGAVDPTDNLIMDFDGERPPGGRVGTVPAGTFAATGGDLIEAFKRGQFGAVGMPVPGSTAGEAFDG